MVQPPKGDEADTVVKSAEGPRQLTGMARVRGRMSPDPRHPVIVGVAQATWRGGDAPSPIEMCAEVVAAAARDAGAGGALLGPREALAVVDIASRRWNDPGALIAGRLGIGRTSRSGRTSAATARRCW